MTMTINMGLIAAICLAVLIGVIIGRLSAKFE